MNNNNNCLLLTGTISPSVKIIGKKLSEINSKNREKEYLKALIFYITESNFDNIIFCENSNFDYSNWSHITFLANKFGKKIELLTFKGNQLYPEKYGYGCGEAEIIDYAINNSELLKKTDYFYKITGRYILGNINLLIRKLSNQENYFQKQGLFSNPLGVSTAFFKISKKIYLKYLYKKHIDFFKDFFSSGLDIKSISKYNYLSLEYVFYILLREYLTKEYYIYNKVKLALFYTFPKPINYGVNSFIRNFIYLFYINVGLGEFNIFNKFLDKILYGYIYFWVKNIKK